MLMEISKNESGFPDADWSLEASYKNSKNNGKKLKKTNTKQIHTHLISTVLVYYAHFTIGSSIRE